MGYIALGIITVILAVAGFVELLKTLITMLYRKPSETAQLLIIPDASDCSNPEFLLRSFAESIRWTKALRPKRIIFITDCLTQEGMEIANLVCKDYHFPELMTAEEYIGELNNILLQNIGKNDCLKKENVL